MRRTVCIEFHGNVNVSNDVLAGIAVGMGRKRSDERQRQGYKKADDGGAPPWKGSVSPKWDQ